MKQIKYVFTDILRNKRVYIFYMIQMIIVLFLIGTVIQSVTETVKGYYAVKKITNAETYVLNDYTNDEHFATLFENETESVIKMRELYEYSINLDIPYYYTQFSYTSDEIDGIDVKQYTVNKNFFDIFNIGISEGRMFNDNDYTINTNEVIPIIVGYKLQNVYNLDKTYSLYDEGTGELHRYKVIGVLNNNAKFYDLYALNTPYNLNYSYIKPLMTSNISELSFSDIDMALSSTVYFSNSIDKVKLIEQKSQKLGLMSYRVDKANSKVDWFISLMTENIQYELATALIVLLFAAIGMSVNLNLIISKNMREFAIHILCGGRYFDIAKRLVLQCLIATILAAIPSIIHIGLNVSVIFTILIVCFITVITSTAPIYKLYKIPVSELLRSVD